MSSHATHPPAATWLPETLEQRSAGWRMLLGPAISLGVLIAALVQLRSIDFGRAIALMPASPGFWLAFAGAYLALPVADWVIYRRLWRLPLDGLLPLLRKRISNELFLGYSGELYFYTWARRRSNLSTAPFGAIKDVAILSAQTGNVATLALIALAWPMLGLLHIGLHGRELLLSCLGVMLLTLPAVLLRRQILSLPPRELRWIAVIHLVRIFAGFVLTALVWHEALPAVALSWWVVLSALRQLLSRLPLVPNKDIVFAGVAAYLVGVHDDLVATIALATTLVIVTHVVLGAMLAVADLATAGDGATAEDRA